MPRVWRAGRLRVGFSAGIRERTYSLPGSESGSILEFVGFGRWTTVHPGRRKRELRYCKKKGEGDLKHSRTVLLVLLLARAASSPELIAQQSDSTAVQQEPRQGEVRGVELEPNYPNPFTRETRIPFVLAPDLFQDGQPVLVSVRIYNVLRQPIAIPIILDHPTAAGQSAQKLRFDTPGRYELYWDGTDRGGQQVASGMYFCEIVANRSRDVRRMLVTR